MAKEKKGKVLQLLSPENYIRQRARTLPISECRVNVDWKKTGLANVAIARRHTNGNITLGIFLVDLKCLGVKDASYRFNISENEYIDFLDLMGGRMKTTLIPYPLAHNIVYAGIEFAEEFGFKPHQDYTSVAKYLLEEDTEAVELIEIECGLNGQPAYLRGPYDSEAKATQIIAQLDRTAGRGNYTIIEEADWDPDLDDEENDFFDEEAWDDEEDEDLLELLQTKSPGLQFKIQIKGVLNPPVWRRVVVPSHYSFMIFNEIIQEIFGWSGSHKYCFSPEGWNSFPQIIEIDDDGDDLGKDRTMESSETVLSEIFNQKGQNFHYIYDFGDNWDHQITLEKILQEKINQPSCIDGEGQCPPEDCGGFPGYQNLKTILANPSDPEYEEMKEWLELEEDETWDPTEFDLQDVQQMLAELFTIDPKSDLDDN